MSIIDILFIGIGLSMDAFAVAMCQGVSMPKLQFGRAVLIAVFFGLFQAVMPLIGFALGSAISGVITIGPWIACAILLVLGVKMLIDGIRSDACELPKSAKSGIGQLVLLAIATSIDALIVGISFAMQHTIVWLHGGTSIFLAVSIIGLTTLLLSLVGVVLGNRVGLRFHKPATIFGGIVLILISIKVVLDSFGLLSCSVAFIPLLIGGPAL